VAHLRGEQLWDYLCVAGAAEAIHGVLTELSAGGIFNLGSDRVQTIRSVRACRTGPVVGSVVSFKERSSVRPEALRKQMALRRALPPAAAPSNQSTTSSANGCSPLPDL
jgi:hypothetical protein